MNLEWIRVEDAMPDDDLMVLAITNTGNFVMAFHNDDGWEDDGCCILTARRVTHWMHPEPPENHPAFK